MTKAKKQPEAVEAEPKVIVTADMTPAEYKAFVEAKANDLSLTAAEQNFARKELGRINAQGALSS